LLLSSKARARRIQYPRTDDRLWDRFAQDARIEYPIEMSQEEYIEILFADCGFTIPQRRAWLRTEYGRAYADELDWRTKSRLIERLKALNAAQHESAAARAAEDEASGLLFGEPDSV
jgi:hypothetical protein